jgi:uncharacterized RDD family membrane protein YckC
MSDETLYLAKWTTRLGAWLIDVILVAIVLELLGAPAEFLGWSLFGVTALDGAVLFAYWTLFDGLLGQSPGKMALNLKVTDRAGGDVDVVTAAVESFGKAFLLPVDCLVGWLAMPGRKLRLFNRLSNTIVVQTRETDAPEGVEYVIPEE